MKVNASGTYNKGHNYDSDGIYNMFMYKYCILYSCVYNICMMYTMILIVYLHSFKMTNNILCTILYNHVYTSHMYIGISFAIPIDTAAQVIKQLKRHKKVIRPYIGINAYSLYTPYSSISIYKYTKYTHVNCLYLLHICKSYTLLILSIYDEIILYKYIVLCNLICTVYRYENG